jgi:hypothetical protein
MLRGERSTAILGLDGAIERRMTQFMHSAYPLSESNAEESRRGISAPTISLVRRYLLELYAPMLRNPGSKAYMCDP